MVVVLGIISSHCPWHRCHPVCIWLHCSSGPGSLCGNACNSMSGILTSLFGLPHLVLACLRLSLLSFTDSEQRCYALSSTKLRIPLSQALRRLLLSSVVTDILPNLKIWSTFVWVITVISRPHFLNSEEPPRLFNDGTKRERERHRERDKDKIKYVTC